MLKVVSANITTAASQCAAVHIADWDKIYFDMPTFATGHATATANVYAMVCDTEAGTYKNLKLSGTYSAGAGIANWEVPSSTGNYRVQVPCDGWNYVKIQLGADTTAVVTCNVVLVNGRP